MTVGLAAVFVAAISAIVAAAALVFSWRESQSRVTLELLRDVQSRLEPAWLIPDVKAVQGELISWYGQQGDSLSPHAHRYLALLSALDLLAFSIEKGLANRALAQEWLRSLFEDETVVSAEFLDRLQKCCNDAVFEHLLKHVREQLAFLLPEA